jgi:hypothetical protein
MDGNAMRGRLPVNEIMTRAEAEALYPNEWILMVDLEPGTDLNYRGRVVAHEKEKANIVRRGMELPKGLHVAVFFAGDRMPPGMKFFALTPRGYVLPEAVERARPNE